VTDARIREELEGIVFLGIERIAVHHCLEQRLAILAEGIAAGRSD